MSASQRKGAAGERELAQILSEQLGWVVERNIGYHQPALDVTDSVIKEFD